MLIGMYPLHFPDSLDEAKGALTQTDELRSVRCLCEANSIHVCGARRCDDVMNEATGPVHMNGVCFAQASHRAELIGLCERTLCQG